LVATLLICMLALEAPNRRFRPWFLVLFAAVGACLVWFSFTSPFVLCGVGCAVAAAELHKRRYGNVISLTFVGVAWLTSFLVYFLTITRHSVANRELTSFWANYFAPLPPRSFWDVRHLIDLSLDPFKDPIGLMGVGLGLVLWLIGSLSLLKQKPLVAGICLLPVAVTLLASGLHLYPFSGRLLIFLIPLLLIPLANGAVSLRSGIDDKATLATAVGVLLMGPLFGINDLLKSPQRSGIRDLNVAVASRLAPGDVVYVYYKAKRAFDLYKDRLNANDAKVVYGSRYVLDGDSYLADFDSLGRPSRAWFLFSEVRLYSGNEEQIMIDDLDRRGTRLDDITAYEAHAYLYDLRTGQ
jgi:hypothetical protein